jgi:hypothetical protein
MWPPAGPGKSMTQLQFLRDGLIPTDISVVEIIQQPTALTHHHQQTPPGAVVFLVLLKMFRQMVDALRQQGNLHIGRSGVSLVQLELLNGFGFRFHKCQFLKILKKYRETNLVLSPDSVKHFPWILEAGFGRGIHKFHA